MVAGLGDLWNAPLWYIGAGLCRISGLAFAVYRGWPLPYIGNGLCRISGMYSPIGLRGGARLDA